MSHLHPRFLYPHRPRAVKEAWLAKSGLFKKLACAASICLFIGSLAFMNAVLQPRAQANGSYQASGELGQYDSGGNPVFDQGPARADGFNFPQDSAVDSLHHRLFVVDEYNDRVLVFNLNSSDHLTTRTAAYVLGQKNFGDSSCPDVSLTASTFCDPVSVAYDSTDNWLFVTDWGDYRVMVYDLSGGISNDMDASWVLGQSDFTSENYGDQNLRQPEQVAFDQADKWLFVADQQNNRIMVYDLSGGISSGMDASWVLGQSDFSTFSGDTTVSKMIDPKGVFYDSGLKQLFVSDTSNSRVLVYDLSGGISDGMDASHVLGQTTFNTGYGDCNTSQSGLCNPNYLGYDTSDNYLFVGDGGNNRIMVYDLSGGISDGMDASWVLGQSGFSGSSSNEGAALPAANGLSGPTSGFYDPASQQLFVTDGGNYRLTIFDLSGGVSTNMDAGGVVGQTDSDGNPTFTTGAINNNAPDSSRLNNSQGVAMDPVNHRLFVADTNNDRVLVYDLDSQNELTGYQASYVLGASNFSSDSCAEAGYAPTDSDLCQPMGLAYDSSNQRLFVGDSENGRVMVFDLSGGISDGMSASYEIGQPNFNTYDYCGATAAGGFCALEGLAYDSTTGYLYTADPGDLRILVFNASPGNISDGMDASYVIGEPDFNTADSVNGTTAVALAIDSTRHLLFTANPNYFETGTSTSDTVSVYDISSLANDDRAPIHTLGDGSCDVNVTATTSCSPQGLAYDPVHQMLYVEDENYNRITLFNTSSFSAGQAAVGVIGAPDLDTQGTYCSVSQSSICPGGTSGFGPVSDYFDMTNNRLYVADGGFNRISYYDFTRITTGSLPGGTVGSHYSGAISQSGGQGTVTFSKSSGSLPGGLALNPATGSLSGTPAAAGIYNFAVEATDNNGPAGSFSDQQSYSVTIAASSGGHSGGSSGGSSSSSGGSSNPPPVAGSPLGGSSGGGSSNGSSGPAPVDLDGSPAETMPDACRGVTSASAGQVFSFTAADGSKHKVTVLQVGAGSIEVRIDNLPKTLYVGQLIDQDVNDDGTPDICVDVLSITDGVARMDIARITFAIASGNHQANGFGAGSSQQTTGSGKAGPGFLTALLSHIPKAVLLVFPWLLFILLGLSFLRLSYLAWQERRLMLRIEKQLALEKALSEEKGNFLALSSHYLRTPLALLTNGIDLMAATDRAGQADELRPPAQELNHLANQLLAALTPPAQTAPQDPESSRTPGWKVLRTATGFVKAGPITVITLSLAASFGLIGLADYILKYVDLYNLSLVRSLTQLAGLLLLGVLCYASLHSYHHQQEVRRQAEVLLNQQRELDAGRDKLVSDSVTQLKPLLDELRQRFAAIRPADTKAAKPALEGIGQLDRLMHKLVILASLKGGRVQALRQPVALNNLVDQVSVRYQSALSGKGLRLRTEVSQITLNQDPLLLSFVIDSLLSNAIKYSPQGGEIVISGRSSHDGAEIAVQDKGPGIAEAKQSELFQPFSRAESAAADFGIQGAGLSLALDKLVMKYIGGTIGLDSHSGEGTIARLSISG